MIEFLRRINPFKSAINTPIHVVLGGTQPWNDRNPPKKQSFPVLGCLMLFICGFSTLSGIGINAITNKPSPTATDWLNSEDLGSYFIESTWIATTKPLTPTMVNTPSEEPSATAVWTWTPQPTYTYAPTQTPLVQELIQVVEVEVTRIVELVGQNVVITAPPVVNVIAETVEVPIPSTVIVVEYVVITATPSPTLHPPDLVITQPPPLLLPPTSTIGVIDVTIP